MEYQIYEIQKASNGVLYLERSHSCNGQLVTYNVCFISPPQSVCSATGGVPAPSGQEQGDAGGATEVCNIIRLFANCVPMYTLMCSKQTVYESTEAICVRALKELVMRAKHIVLLSRLCAWDIHYLLILLSPHLSLFTSTPSFFYPSPPFLPLRLTSTSPLFPSPLPITFIHPPSLSLLHISPVFVRREMKFWRHTWINRMMSTVSHARNCWISCVGITIPPSSWRRRRRRNRGGLGRVDRGSDGG